jgi:phage portal protein BeeE
MLSPNEARRDENMPPVVGGESPYLQQQNYSLLALSKRDAQADPFATSTPALPAPKPETDDESDDDEEVSEDAKMLADIMIRAFSEPVHAS